MKIQVLYPIFNLDEEAKQRFFESMKSIKNQTPNHDIEFCISDGGTEKTEKLKRPKGKFKYHYENTKKPFSRSKVINNGIRELIDEDIFILADIDIIYSPSFMDRAINLYKKHQKSIVFPTLFLQHSGKDDYTKKEEQIFKKGVNNFFYGFNEHRPPSGFFTGWGPLSLLKTRDVVSINGFDNDFVGWGFEDVDFYLRLRLQSSVYFKEFLENDIFTYHLSHETNYFSERFQKTIENYFLLQKKKLYFIENNDFAAKNGIYSL
jgi:predicted glycosyltransferase involved in capsule biosynthesis